MFSLSKKLDTNLRDILNNNDIEYYRVLIKYKTLQDSISKKILTPALVPYKKKKLSAIILRMIAPSFNLLKIQLLIDYKLILHQTFQFNIWIFISKPAFRKLVFK